jgi:hypothetical protein
MASTRDPSTSSCSWVHDSGTGTDHRPEDHALSMAAHVLADDRYSIFPLRPGTKRPAVRDWERRATTDLDRIWRCWGELGQWNIGVACGPSRLVVIDLDAAHDGETPPPQWARPGVRGGVEVFAALCADHGQPVPDRTYTVRTPSGGMHLYYRAPEDGPELRNTAGRLGWRIDTRAAGGYVVGAGSVIAGRPYVLVHDYHYPPVPLPGWLADLLHPAPPPAGPAEPVPMDPLRQSAYLTAALRAEHTRVRDAPTGQRNRALYLAAVALGQLVAGGAVSEAQVRYVLDHATTGHLAADAYTEREREATIASGLRAGAKRPRQVAA